MNLDIISFVGIDVKTDKEELLNIESKFPCEFGVLYSESKNSIRYPDYDFCYDFLTWANVKELPRSLHLCGSVIDKYLAQDPKIVELANQASRIQLNLNIKKYSDYDKLADAIIAVASKNCHSIILQKNKVKMKFNAVFEAKYKKLPLSKLFCLSLLNDSSGGFGREITKVLPPYEYYTGYAGGINPENVCSIVKLIEAVTTKQGGYYIDMESGIREDNVFSIAKCREIIKNVHSMT